MHPSSILLLLGPGAALASPAAVRRQEVPATVIENGSFESGISNWTLAGGASVVANSDSNPWRFQATDGTNFAILQSSNANATSSITTHVEGLDHTQQWTFSFDWDYLFIANTHGPPSIYCTLQTQFFDNTYIGQSWTRRASLGGSGHVEETLSTNFGGSALTIAFSCAGDQVSTTTFNAGVAIDNVKWFAAS